jgi:hypothetical protein
VNGHGYSHESYQQFRGYSGGLYNNNNEVEHRPPGAESSGSCGSSGTSGSGEQLSPVAGASASMVDSYLAVQQRIAAVANPFFR